MEDYTPDDDEQPRQRRRRAIARQGFAEGVAESMGGTVTRVDDEDDDVIDVEEVEEVEEDEGATVTHLPSSNQQRQHPSTQGLRKGWGGGQKVIEQNSNFAQRFTPVNEPTIIKFLEDSPYVSYARHWMDRIGQGGQKSSIPYVCLGSLGKQCPLCDIGDRPQAVSGFNVAIIDDEGEVSLKSWDVGVRIFNTLQNFHNDQKIGPLSRLFYIVTASGKGQQKQTNVAPASKSTLREMWDVEPPSDEVFKALGVYDSSIVDIPKVSVLEEIAAEQASSDEYDD
jgi:hypothetical protein